MSKLCFRISFAILTILLLSINVMASEYDNSDDISVLVTMEDEYVAIERTPITNITDIQIDIEYLLANSSNIIRSGSELRGSYSSPKYDTGLPGYKYDVNFEWVAAVDSTSTYYFKDYEISEAYVTTYVNHLILVPIYEYYTYDIVRNEYEVSEDGYSVTFYTDYNFTVRHKGASFTEEFTEYNSVDITIEELL